MKAIGRGSVSSFLGVVVNVGWYVAAAGLVLAVCLALFALVGDLSNAQVDIPVSFSIDGRTFSVVDASHGSAQFESVRGRGNLKFTPPSRIFLASTAATLALWLAMVWWGLGQLRAVFRTLRDGHPFVPANAIRIRRTAYVVIGGELTRYAFGFLGNGFAARHFSAGGLKFDTWPDLNLLALASGLVIFVIAEVFAEGARLDEDQSLTV